MSERERAGFIAANELQSMGFAEVGRNVSLSRYARIYGASRISIGENSRIDDFTILSAGQGGIRVGRNVHIACYCFLAGAGKITLEDFAGISGRVSIYSSSDDFVGPFLTGPTVPDAYRNVSTADVSLGRHVVVGAGSVLLPGAVLEEGVTVGALSLVTKRLPAWTVWAGNPAKHRRDRQRNESVERAFLASEGSGAPA